MSKIRVVYKPDKTVAIIYPAPKSRKSDETEEQWLERVFSKLPDAQRERVLEGFTDGRLKNLALKGD